MGVKNAPILEPITVANTAGSPAALPLSAIMEENSTLMGILFIMFAERKEDMPYFIIGSFSPIKAAVFSVNPMSPRTTIITNMERTNGTN